MFFNVEATSYYLEVDMKFSELKRGRSKVAWIGFNYDSKDHTEGVVYRFEGGKLCAYYSFFDNDSGNQTGGHETRFFETCMTVVFDQGRVRYYSHVKQSRMRQF